MLNFVKTLQYSTLHAVSEENSAVTLKTVTTSIIIGVSSKTFNPDFHNVPSWQRRGLGRVDVVVGVHAPEHPAEEATLRHRVPAQRVQRSRHRDAHVSLQRHRYVRFFPQRHWCIMFFIHFFPPFFIFVSEIWNGLW